MQITAQMVKKLREETGLPMMDCKKALTEAGGDEQKAKELLRARGLKVQDKMADREAGEGRIFIHVDPDSGTVGVVDLRCETDPVAGTEDFARLGEALARVVATLPEPPTAESLLEMKLADDPSRTLRDLYDEVFNRIRENLKIARVDQFRGHVAHYIHFDGKTAAVVEFSQPCPEELAAGVCMHIAAMNPRYARREDVPAEQIEAERASLREQVKDKPPQIIDKIVEGKLGRWFSEFVLLDQPYVKDDKKTVGQALREAAPELTVLRFARYRVGG